MADELNTPNHRWYEPRNHIALAKEDVSRQYIFDSGIQKIDAWINSQPWGLGSAIRALFAADEPGVWYDPSDLDTLFQDTAGTTPVTTAGQTVALMLDKSKGLTLGPELLPNSFSSGVWSNFAAGVSVADGIVSFSNVTAGVNGLLLGPANGSPYQASKSFEVVLTISNYVSGGLRVWTGAGYTQVYSENGAFSVRVYYPADQNVRVYAPTTGADTNLSATISVRELPGYHATQPTAAARPEYQTDGTLHWLAFDGVDDFMVTPTITPGIDKVQVFAGVRKLNNDTRFIYAMSYPSSSDEGYWYVSNTSNNAFISKGTSVANASSSNPAPATTVITSLGDISGDSAIIRFNGAQVSQSTNDQGTGNYLTYPLEIGGRSASSSFFTGNIYSLITRFGANLEANEIAQSETYVAAKTGVTL